MKLLQADVLLLAKFIAKKSLRKKT